ERIERGAQVGDLVRDVVHPRPSLREELPDGSLRAERREQLDAPVADQHRRRFDALLGHGRTVLDLGAEEPLVRRDRLVEIVDRNPEVMNPARLHADDATGPYLPPRWARSA